MLFCLIAKEVGFQLSFYNGKYRAYLTNICLLCRQSGLLGDDPNPILLGMAVGNSPSPSNNEVGAL